MGTYEDVIGGNPRSIGRAISLVENGGPGSRELMRRVRSLRARALIFGVTGATGSGKSTLVDRLIGPLREKRKKVGIIAIDPSSPFTGGSVLGDRIRMMRHASDPGVFIRSMATRGHAGGLARAAADAAAILSAAETDIVLVETVGVGQAEVEVIDLADVVLVLLTPGAGDEIQISKAGIMEIADIFVLNKSDLPGSERLEAQVGAMLDLGPSDASRPSIFKTSATEGMGIDRLVEEMLRLGVRRKRRVRAQPAGISSRARNGS